MKKFDKNKDHSMWYEEITIGNQILTVELVSYDNNKAKIQISRAYLSKTGEKKHVKLGRISIEEMKKLLPLLKEASSQEW